MRRTSCQATKPDGIEFGNGTCNSGLHEAPFGGCCGIDAIHAARLDDDAAGQHLLQTIAHALLDRRIVGDRGFERDLDRTGVILYNLVSANLLDGVELVHDLIGADGDVARETQVVDRPALDPVDHSKRDVARGRRDGKQDAVSDAITDEGHRVAMQGSDDDIPFFSGRRRPISIPNLNDYGIIAGVIHPAAAAFPGDEIALDRAIGVDDTASAVRFQSISETGGQLLGAAKDQLKRKRRKALRVFFKEDFQGSGRTLDDVGPEALGFVQHLLWREREIHTRSSEDAELVTGQLARARPDDEPAMPRAQSVEDLGAQSPSEESQFLRRRSSYKHALAGGAGSLMDATIVHTEAGSEARRKRGLLKVVLGANRELGQSVEAAQVGGADLGGREDPAIVGNVICCVAN